LSLASTGLDGLVRRDGLGPIGIVRPPGSEELGMFEPAPWLGLLEPTTCPTAGAPPNEAPEDPAHDRECEHDGYRDDAAAKRREQNADYEEREKTESEEYHLALRSRPKGCET
jgi:hypothetical protein